MFIIKELKIDNFNTDNVTDMSYMFSKCSDELKLKIKNKFDIFDEDCAFDDDEGSEYDENDDKDKEY